MRPEKFRIGRLSVLAVLTKPADGYRLLGPVKTMVHVLDQSKVKAGDFLYLKGKPAYLLASHHSNSVSTVFAGLELNCDVVATEIITSVNPVTQMKSSSTEGPPISLKVCQDLVSSSEVLGLKVPEFVYYTNVPLTTKHKINGQRIQHVALLNGIYRVEVGS